MRYLKVVVFSFCLIFSQNVDQKPISPCKDPLITLAEEEGIKAIPLRDIRRFKKLLEDCERQGEKKRMERLVYNDWQRDYEKAKKMQSWSSTHAMCVFVSFAYFFAGHALATDPGK